MSSPTAEPILAEEKLASKRESKGLAKAAQKATLKDLTQALAVTAVPPLSVPPTGCKRCSPKFAPKETPLALRKKALARSVSRTELAAKCTAP